MNKIVKAYITTDIIFWSVNAFMISFFPIYAESTNPNKILLVSFIVATYAFSRGIFQIPLSKIMDRFKGYYDEKIFMYFGIFISAFSILILLFNVSTMALFARQIIAGFGNAMFLIAVKKQINKHIDLNNVGFEIALNESSVLIISAFLIILAGGITDTFGFITAFVVVGIINLFAFIPVIMVTRQEVIEDLAREGMLDSKEIEKLVKSGDDINEKVVEEVKESER